MSQYDFGRLLIIDGDVKVKKSDIKKLTGSKYADELKRSDRDAWSIRNLHTLIRSALSIRSGSRRQQDYKIYAVDNDAKSTMFALGDYGFVAALTINQSEYERLRKLEKILEDALQIVSYTNLMLNIQDNSLKRELDEINFEYNFDNFSTTLREFSENYIKDNLSEIVEEFNSLLDSNW